MRVMEKCSGKRCDDRVLNWCMNMADYTVVAWYKPTVDSGKVIHEQSFGIYYDVAREQMKKRIEVYSWQVRKGLIAEYEVTLIVKGKKEM